MYEILKEEEEHECLCCHYMRRQQFLFKANQIQNRQPLVKSVAQLRFQRFVEIFRSIEVTRQV